MAFELLWYHYLVTGKTLNTESTASSWSWALMVKPTQVHLASPGFDSRSSELEKKSWIWEGVVSTGRHMGGWWSVWLRWNRSWVGGIGLQSLRVLTWLTEKEEAGRPVQGAGCTPAISQRLTHGQPVLHRYPDQKELEKRSWIWEGGREGKEGAVLFCCLFQRQGLMYPGWPQTWYIDKDHDPKLQIFLLLLPKHWWLADTTMPGLRVLGIEPRASGMLGKHCGSLSEPHPQSLTSAFIYETSGDWVRSCNTSKTRWKE